MTTTNGTRTVTREDTLVLLCDVCKKPVIGKSGYICVDKAVARENRRLIDKNREELKAQYPGKWALIPALEIMDVKPARWHIYHRVCDPQQDSINDYWYCVSRCRTARDLLFRTAHLLGKDWIGTRTGPISSTASSPTTRTRYR